MTDKTESLSFFDPDSVVAPEGLSTMTQVTFDEGTRKLTYKEGQVTHEVYLPYSEKNDLNDVIFDVEESTLTLVLDTSEIVVDDFLVQNEFTLPTSGNGGVLVGNEFMPLEGKGGIEIEELEDHFLVSTSDTPPEPGESKVGLVGIYQTIASGANWSYYTNSSATTNWVPISFNGKEDPYDFITVAHDGGFQLPEGVYWLDVYLHAFRVGRLWLAIMDQDGNRILDFPVNWTSGSGNDGVASGSGYIKSNGTDTFYLVFQHTTSGSLGYVGYHANLSGTTMDCSPVKIMISKEDVNVPTDIPTLPRMEPVIEAMSSSESNTQRLTVSESLNATYAPFRLTTDDNIPWATLNPTTIDPFVIIEFKDGNRDIDWIMLTSANHVRIFDSWPRVMEAKIEYRVTENDDWILLGEFQDMICPHPNSAFVHRLENTVSVQAIRFSELKNSNGNSEHISIGQIQFYKEVSV